MEEIARSNFIDAVKLSQKSIFTGSVFSVSLYIFALKSELNLIEVPLIGVEVDAVQGLWAFLILYFMTGVALCFYSLRAKSNFNLIDNIEVKSALLLYPSVVCGDPAMRYFSALSPAFLFALAMSEAYDAIFLKVLFMVSIFSSPYIFALWCLDYEAPSTAEGGEQSTA